MEVHTMPTRELDVRPIPSPPSVIGPINEVLHDDARSLIRGSLSEATWRAYQSDRELLLQWGRDNRVEVLPATPELVANYIGSMMEALAPSTILRRVAFWSWWHDAQGIDPNPCRSTMVRNTLKGLRRRPSTPIKARPLTSVDLVEILTTTPGGSLKAIRDRALLVVGLALGRRRSELVALDVEDLQWLDQGHPGYSVTIRRSKTDQEGEGQTVFLPRTGSVSCPVRHLEEWLKAGGITTGAIFRSVNQHAQIGERLSDRSVSTILKEATERAGLPVGNWSGHSLRAGFVTETARRGASTRSIARQTGHSPTSPVIHGYIRFATPDKDNAVTTEGWI
jgi:site-specific recombinase XerD